MSFSCSFSSYYSYVRNRLVGLVVKTAISRAENSRFDSACSMLVFFASYYWLKNWHSGGYPVKTRGLSMQIKPSISPSHSLLTPGQPLPAITLESQAPGRVAIGVPTFKSLLWLDPEKIPNEKVGIEPGSDTLQEDVLTARPTRRSPHQYCDPQTCSRRTKKSNATARNQSASSSACEYTGR